jgi:hypothetical protein
MSGRFAACLALAGLAIAHTATAEAATLKRSLPCSTLYFVFGALTGTTNSSAVFMKNNGSSAIPAGTVYTYTIPAGTFESRNPAALAPGETYRVGDARVTDTGSCAASVPGVAVKQLNAVPLQKLTLNPG